MWTGDVPSTWVGLEQTLPMLLGLGMSGVPFVGSDVGGYSGGATPELFARWLQLGVLSPFFRAHVTNGVPGQEPWGFGHRGQRHRPRVAARALPAAALLRVALALASSRNGAPVLRPLAWEFPDEPALAAVDDQAMLGPVAARRPRAERGRHRARRGAPARALELE